VSGCLCWCGSDLNDVYTFLVDSECECEWRPPFCTHSAHLSRHCSTHLFLIKRLQLCIAVHRFRAWLLCLCAWCVLYLYFNFISFTFWRHAFYMSRHLISVCVWVSICVSRLCPCVCMYVLFIQSCICSCTRLAQMNKFHVWLSHLSATTRLPNRSPFPNFPFPYSFSHFPFSISPIAMAISMDFQMRLICNILIALWAKTFSHNAIIIEFFCLLRRKATSACRSLFKCEFAGVSNSNRALIAFSSSSKYQVASTQSAPR